MAGPPQGAVVDGIVRAEVPYRTAVGLLPRPRSLRKHEPGPMTAFTVVGELADHGVIDRFLSVDKPLQVVEMTGAG
jgi:hypothetical protein